MKRSIAKLVFFLLIVVAIAASCRAPKDCWGVSSDTKAPAAEAPVQQN